VVFLVIHFILDLNVFFFFILAGTHGLFTKEDKITEMGSQITAYIVTNYHDCILHCLGNVKCSEVILVSNQACILYQSA
jgi:hypothetical protein